MNCLGMCCFTKSKDYSRPLPFLTSAQLLSQALEQQNSVAYELYNAHAKKLKEKQNAREFYFYIFAMVALNLCFSGSLANHVLSLYPLVGFPMLVVTTYYGLVWGVAKANNEEDTWTDVQPIKPSSSTSARPPMLYSNQNLTN